MAIEIERRFFVQNKSWKQFCSQKPLLLVQGYVAKGDGFIVRVRVIGDEGKLTLKSKKERMTHQEYEYDIPVADAIKILDTIPSHERIEKMRYELVHDGRLWEIDEFLGDNAGLCIAEIELEDENESFSMPEWVQKEITHDDSYSNYALSKCPFRERVLMGKP